MKAVKKILAISLLFVFVVGFLFSITEVPYASAAGGTFCDEGSELFCWTNKPSWLCLSNPGGDDCVEAF